MNEGYIHSFESFGTVDGPGIRFVIFMQGCPLRCLYCHNPDTWDYNINKKLTVDEVVAEVVKYRRYFRENGGVTISGGEPLTQFDFILDLVKALKKENINVAIDTSGVTFNKENESKFLELIEYVDLFLLDLKHIDPKKHLELTKVKNDNILAFATFLSENKKRVWIRHVLVPGYTTNEEYLRKLKTFINTLTNVEKIEVLPYHTLGVVKYKNLNLDYPLKDTLPPTKTEVEKAKEILRGQMHE